MFYFIIYYSTIQLFCVTQFLTYHIHRVKAEKNSSGKLPELFFRYASFNTYKVFAWSTILFNASSASSGSLS